MGKIVNLNKFRKSKQRDDRKQLVALNRQKFGRPKAELVRLEGQRSRDATLLEAHRLASGDDSRPVDPDDDLPLGRPGEPRETD